MDQSAHFRSMEMVIICTDIEGFEDALSLGACYRVETLGRNDFQIIDDNLELRYYGESKFRIVVE